MKPESHFVGRWLRLRRERDVTSGIQFGFGLAMLKLSIVASASESAQVKG